MITETGRVVAIGSECLWVETIQESTCGSCTAKKGCGHSLLDSTKNAKRNHLRVLLNDQTPDNYSLNDEVTFSVPEHVVVLGALLVYLAPLAGLFLGAILTSLWWPSDFATFIGGVVGFIVGIALVKLHSVLNSDNVHWQPVVLPRSYSSTAASATSVGINLHQIGQN